MKLITAAIALALFALLLGSIPMLKAPSLATFARVDSTFGIAPSSPASLPAPAALSISPTELTIQNKQALPVIEADAF